jgi:GTP cyclohydrolase I/GTP cyclohydrolase-4
MVRMAVAEFRELDREAFVLARQENLETIHRHNVVAERYGLLEELAGALADGDGDLRHVTMAEWLEGASR